MTEYIEFHVDSFYETSRFFIFGFAPSYSSNNKGNWQLRAERKKKKKAKQPIPVCLGLHSRL